MNEPITRCFYPDMLESGINKLIKIEFENSYESFDTGINNCTI